MDRNLARAQYDYPARRIRSHSPKHILVINWHGKIGDAIISSFFFREIRKKYKNICISVITVKNLENLYRNFFLVDQVLLIEQLSFEKLMEFLPLLKDVDTVVPLIGILDTFHIFLLGKIQPVSVLGIDPFLQMINPNYRKKATTMLVHDMYKCMLSFLGCCDINDSYIIPLSKKKTQESYSIIFNPFGSRSDKSLCVEKSVSILHKIVENFPDKTIGVLSSPSTEAICKKIVASTKGANISQIPGICSFYDIIPYIFESKLVISVDTSVVHIATGLNKKVIAIYYGTEDIFNCWLPCRNASVELIFSNGPKQYLFKDMNNFNDEELIIKARRLI